MTVIHSNSKFQKGGKLSEIQLGLGSKNYGEINTTELKGGIKREQLKSENEKSIFDAVDTDKNGVLDANEMQQFSAKLQDAAGNEKLSKREAKKFLKNENLKDIDKKELFNFINSLSESSENIASSQVLEENGQKTILVTYKDGSQETINPDKTSQIVSTDENNTVTTKFFDENKELTQEKIVQENGDNSVTDIENGLPVKKTTVSNNGSKTSVIEYENGKEVKEQIKEGSVQSSYQYVDGKPVITEKIEDLGNNILRTTDYKYNEDGTITENITEPNKQTIRQTKDGKALSEVITEDNKKTERLYKEDGTTQEIITEGDNKTATLYNTETGKRLQQSKIVNGKQYNIAYDGAGNTTGIIVQNGESISDIAKKFGCSEKELKEVNKDILKGKKYFNVGDEIKIPREIDANSKALNNRKSAQEAKAEYARDAEIRRQKAEIAKAKQQEQAYYKKLGVKSFKNKGKKVKADGWGNKTFEVVGQLGYARQLVKRDGKLYTMSHDNKILREDYLQAHKAFVSKPKKLRNNTASGIKDVTYVKDKSGKVWYFDEKTGKAIVKGGYQKVVKQEVAYVSNQLYKAAKGAGTDTKLLKKGIDNIYSRDILKGVNNELKTKDSDYAGDAQTMPVEALILDEMSHGSARPLFKTLIKSGTMTTEEQAHTIKREIEHEVHGGILGYTSTSDLNEVLQLADNRDLRLEIEAQFKKDHPELKENQGSVVRQYIAEDGWNAQEVDQFDANWIKTGAYAEAKYVYKKDENGNILLDKNGKPVMELDKGDQAHRNGVIGRLVFDYNDKEALNKGLDAVNDDPNSFDYKYLDSRAGQEIAKDPKGKYKSRFTNQDNVQRYLAGFHSDNKGQVDAGNVSASNTCLFKGLKPARVQAEEALYKAQQGDYSHTFDSMDTETYSEIADLVANGDVKGVKNMTDLYNKAINSTTDTNDKTKIKANAMISGQIKFSDKEITDFCIDLMHSIDANRGMGSSTGTSAGHTNAADAQTEQLKAILQNNPQVLNSVKNRVEKENFAYKTTIQNHNGSASIGTTNTYVTNTKDTYRQILADTKSIVSESVFYDSNGKKITDPEQIKAIKASNMKSLNQMRKYVAELEREYKKGVDAEGWLSDAANGLSTYSGVGTDREDVATEYKNAKVMLNQLEAAAQGKLRDSKGNVISVQDLAKQMVDKQKALSTTNSDYKQTIAYGKMTITLAPVMAATTIASGGAAAVGFGSIATAAVSGAAAGATTYGINALEYNTSYTGNTAEAREQNLEDSLVNGVTTAVGIGQMKYISGMANNMKTAARAGIRLATTVGADTGVGVLSEYASTGDISAQGTMTNMLMSGVGNAIGVRSLSKKVPTSGINKGTLITNEAPITGRNEIADAEIARNIDKSHLNARDRQMVEREIEAQQTPTQAELDAYAKEHAYQAPTAEEQAALDKHQAQVRKEYADAHKIENNAKIQEQKPKSSITKDEIAKLQDEVKSIDGQINVLNKKIFGAKRFGKNTKDLEEQLATLKQTRETKISQITNAQKAAEVKPQATSEAQEVANSAPIKNNKANEAKQEPFKPITSEKDAIDYYNKTIEDRAIIFSTDEEISLRSRRNAYDGNAFFTDVQGWRYEVYKSSGSGNYEADFTTQKKQIQTPWKIHIYADSPEEWANAAQVALPVLREKKIMYKTMCGIEKKDFNALDNAVFNGKHTQKGKAFTVYFRSEDEFVQTAKNLDEAFKKSGLKSSGKVSDEGQIGETGFLSYRHEGGKRGISYKPDNIEDPYLNSISSNNASAKVAPAASSNPLTSQDKIAISYIGDNLNRAKNLNDLTQIQAQLEAIPNCPQKQRLQQMLNEKSSMLNAEYNTNNAEDLIAIDDYTNAKAGTTLPKNQPVFLNGTETLNLANYQLDLSSPQIQAKLKAMKNGEQIIVGREGDIKVDPRYNGVSRKHLTIEKTTDGYVIKDISSNGTTIGQKSTVNTSNSNRIMQSAKNSFNYNSSPRLDKYKYNKNRKPQSHGDFYSNRRDLFSNLHAYDCWAGYTPQNQQHGAWKMHLFSNNEMDWQNISEAIIPYLREHDIDWKTFNIANGADTLNNTIQEGKAFTIYPRDNAHMAQVAKDLDYIIRNNHLELNGTNITGDREMGNSGRLFYRYEYKTGSVKDEVVDLSDHYGYQRYLALYDGNGDRIKRHGQARYLADDMTPEDDPWLNFDPSNP